MAIGNKLLFEIVNNELFPEEGEDQKPVLGILGSWMSKICVKRLDFLY